MATRSNWFSFSGHNQVYAEDHRTRRMKRGIQGVRIHGRVGCKLMQSLLRGGIENPGYVIGRVNALQMLTRRLWRIVVMQDHLQAGSNKPVPDRP
jgi:hypothetical protein